MKNRNNAAEVAMVAASSGKTRTPLSSVTNAMRLLKVFGNGVEEIGITDLGMRLDLAKSTVHRLAAALVEAGILEKNSENEKYRLGAVIYELGSAKEHGKRN